MFSTEDATTEESLEASFMEHRSNGQVAQTVLKKQQSTPSTDKSSPQDGVFRKAIPCMPLCLAIMCCVLNVCLPGLGTFISAFTVFRCGTTLYDNKYQAFGLNLLASFLQLLTAVILVGVVWSILWGIIFVNLARRWWLRIEQRDYTMELLNITV